MKKIEETFITYIPRVHELHADHISELTPDNDSLYLKAQGELLCPPSSVRLKRFSKLDQMIGGLRPYEFTILCGGTGTGKTTLCANLSLDLLEQKIPQFVASVETGQTDYIKRMISARARHDWNTGEAIDKDMLKLFNAENREMFETAPFWISRYEDRAANSRLMADIALAIKVHGIKIAIIDNLNFFMEVTTAANAVIEMDRVIHDLIIFCKLMPIHIIMVMHPRKTDGGRVLNEFDIKGSSTAVQEAHNIFLFNRVDRETIDEGTAKPNDREIKICKMRRLGKFVGNRLILSAENGVHYIEGEVIR